MHFTTKITDNYWVLPRTNSIFRDIMYSYMAVKQFKFCRLVQENDGRFRVYWNTINPDGSTKRNKCRVRDKKEGLEKCKTIDAELSVSGLVEKFALDAEDKIMIERFYKGNRQSVLRNSSGDTCPLSPIPSKVRLYGNYTENGKSTV